MPKTCRTCEFRDFYCDEPAGTPVHIRRLGADGGDCPYWSQGETPLLVDEMAKHLAEVTGRLDAEYRFSGKCRLRSELQSVQAAKIVLARHQQEVGDA